MMLMDNSVYQFLVKEEKRVRTDIFLKSQLPFFSRSFIQELIRKGKVLVNGRVGKQAYLLRKGDRVRIEVLSFPQLTLVPEPIPLDILWEDSYLLVVNKSSGMSVHPVSFKQRGTLVNALLYHSPHLSKVGGILRQGVVHRLDKNTSGVMVVAKDDYTHLALAAQFRKRVVKKIYLALARGEPAQDKGIIEMRIGRNPAGGKKMSREGKFSREAITHYQVLKQWEKWCLLELRPLTGRTHQIRLHLHSINCLLVGDKLYGGKKWQDFPCKIERGMLHAKSLGFFHPREKKWMEFEALLPLDMKEAIEVVSRRSSLVARISEKKKS